MSKTNGTTSGLTFTAKLHFATGENGQKQLRAGEAPVVRAAPAGRVPKLARLMALAIRFEGLLKRGEVKDYAELARLGHVTQAPNCNPFRVLIADLLGQRSRRGEGSRRLLPAVSVCVRHPQRPCRRRFPRLVP